MSAKLVPTFADRVCLNKLVAESGGSGSFALAVSLEVLCGVCVWGKTVQ
jgi:hypothetical protein